MAKLWKPEKYTSLFGFTVWVTTRITFTPAHEQVRLFQNNQKYVVVKKREKVANYLQGKN